MTQQQKPADSDSEVVETVYSGALDRIRRCMLVMGVLVSLGAWLSFGWRIALGLLCGCAVAFLNFQWLKSGVEAFTERIVQTGKSRSARGIVLRFLLRYVLIGLTAYGILTVSPASLYGFLAGLFLPVAAVACEAAYEAYLALARGL